jgi:hypothetical protein
MDTFFEHNLTRCEDKPQMAAAAWVARSGRNVEVRPHKGYVVLHIRDLPDFVT